MIVYVATYPRSGSGVLTRAIYLNFGHVTADGYGRVSSLDPMLDAHVCDHPVHGFADDLWWPEWMHTYTGPDGVRRRMVGPPALKRLKPEARERLAADPCLYFVKTHEPPFARWFEGEKVIRMVRHPAAAIASHFELEKRFASDNARELERLIRGDCIGGDWSKYQRAWRDADLPALSFSYEAAFADQARVVREIAGFLSLPLGPVIVETLDQAHARNPARNPGRGLNGWRSVLSPDDVGLIRNLHGETAFELGYEFEDQAA